MKLRNKKTREIVEVENLCLTQSQELQLTFTDEKNERNLYITGKISTFENEWEDYEEPKEYWYYDTTKNGVEKITHLEDKEKDQAIGNYFETKKEAEKAVEKLKAWKRLKDRGFRFIDHIDRDTGQGMTRYEWNGYINGEDLDLLFSQEDD